jgi:phage terminase small subunit
MAGENRPIRTPAGLHTRARRLFREVVDGWELDPDRLVLLEAAARALTRLLDAEAQVAADGLTVVGSRGQPRPNPLLATIDTERRAVAVLLKQLDLARDEDEEPARDWRGKFAKGDLRGHASKGHPPAVRLVDRYANGGGDDG